LERSILFRGKSIATNKWIYGGYNRMGDKHFIVKSGQDPKYGMFTVHPNSVGQYTNQFDSTGDYIFENDIVYSPSDNEYANISWDKQTSRFIIEFDGWCSDFDHFSGKDLEVTGNTFDEGWYETND
jgi:hypothetical protein